MTQPLHHQQLSVDVGVVLELFELHIKIILAFQLQELFLHGVVEVLVLFPLGYQFLGVLPVELHHILRLEVVGDGEEPWDLLSGVVLGDVEEDWRLGLLHLEEDFVELGFFLAGHRGHGLLAGEEAVFD